MARFTLENEHRSVDVSVSNSVLGKDTLEVMIDNDYPMILELEGDTLYLCVWTNKDTDVPDHKIKLEW